MRKHTFFLLALLVYQISSKAQLIKSRETLQRLSSQLKYELSNSYRITDSLAKDKHWPVTINGQQGEVAKLVGRDRHNKPVYYTTFNNIDAAATVNTSQLWQGGNSGLNLNGSSPNMKNKLAIWDGGRVRDTHIELVGRVNRMDSSVYNGGGSNHATHVTGTMMAAGINPLVKGMSNGLLGILTYVYALNGSDYNDIAEISGVANHIFLSNHSYGTVCGWYQGGDGSWYWFGNNGDSVDYNFGYYSDETKQLDNITYNASYYLPVRASGNSRNQNGPAIGGTYFYYDANNNLLSAIRKAGISSNDSYNTLASEASGKNIITVGAVSPIPAGYTQPSDVVMTSFSSWGPTDDGRIKPDLVGDGLDVLSTVAQNDSAYDYDSGTSMASPNVTGSLLLLQEYYSKLHNGDSLRAATIKGLAIHTANEAGTFPGPDYQFGWGLLNTQGAAEVIKVSNNTKNASTSKHLLYENILNNGQTYTQTITATNSGSLKVTISWTDPAATVTTVDSTHPPISRLVNDLDLRVIKNGTTYFPWVLNPAMPSAAATTGDNYLDNVEQVVINNVSKGDVFTLRITHKGTLSGNLQAYSLLVSQPGDTTLPLNLVNFSAIQMSGSVQLQWATSNEINAKYIVIEKSQNTGDWISIDTIGAKNSSNINTYSYTDAQPASGKVYYRLKLINTDGSYAYSTIKEVDINTTSSSFELSPNPTNDVVLMSFDKKVKHADILVYDVLGKLVSKESIAVDGTNRYAIKVKQLVSGVYIIRANTNIGSFANKLLIKH